LAQSVPDSGGVMFVPAFTGLGAPYWKPDARGAIVGLTRGSTMGHIARAALESIAFQSAALLEAMGKDAVAAGAAPVAELRVDGGASANDLLMQFQADAWRHASARGVAVELVSGRVRRGDQIRARACAGPSSELRASGCASGDTPMPRRSTSSPPSHAVTSAIAVPAKDSNHAAVAGC